jgi:hypothetical protein
MVKYNYNESTFYKNQFEKTLKNGGYLKIPYASKSNMPNLSSDVYKGDYIAKTLYIIKKTHVTGIDYDGELIIEHSSLTNNEPPVYTCFLLKTQTSIQSDIDDLINGSSDCTLNLNTHLSSETNAMYNDHAIIFPTPILIGSSLDKYTSEKIIPNSDEYTRIQIKPILGNVEVRNVEGFKEGADQFIDVATYCQPIDEEDPSIGTDTLVSIPADGKVAINKAVTSQLTTALNFFGFFMLVLFVVLVVPSLHHFFIIKLVLENKYNDPAFTPQQLLNRLSSIDIFVCFILFGFSFSLINAGIVKNAPTTTIVGFYVFIFFISSFIVLQYKRMFDKDNFIKYFKISGVLDPDIEKVTPDIVSALYINIVYLFVSKEKAQDGTSYLQFHGTFIISLIIFGILFAIMQRVGLHDTGSGFMSVTFYIFLLAIYITHYIKYSRESQIRGE